MNLNGTGVLGESRSGGLRREVFLCARNLTLVAGLMLACGGVETPDRGTPERIVLIVVDTLRRDHVGVYGAERPTPNFDRIAASGTVFRNAFSSFHATSMSMGALFTGRTPSLESESLVRDGALLRPRG